MGCTTSKDKNNNKRLDRLLSGHNRKFKSYYSLGEKVGHGAFAQVRLCTHLPSGDIRVVKIITKPYSLDDFQLEVFLLRSVGDGSCPHVVSFIDYFEDTRYYYSIMEYCKGGDLFQRLGDDANKSVSVTDEVFSSWIKQLLQGVAHIHSRGIVHRDIKPHNLLFFDQDCSTLKIVDFGLSYVMEKGQLLDEPCGTPEFLSPEMILGRYGRKIDIWAVGVLCYICLFGCRPFTSSSDPELFREIVETEPSFAVREGGSYCPSHEAITFCRMLLQKNSRVRPTAADALKHQWITREMLPRLPTRDEPIPENIRRMARTESAAIDQRAFQRGMVTSPHQQPPSAQIIAGRKASIVDSLNIRVAPPTRGTLPPPQPPQQQQLLDSDRGASRKRTRVSVRQYAEASSAIESLRASDVFQPPNPIHTELPSISDAIDEGGGDSDTPTTDDPASAALHSVKLPVFSFEEPEHGMSSPSAISSSSSVQQPENTDGYKTSNMKKLLPWGLVRRSGHEASNSNKHSKNNNKVTGGRGADDAAAAPSGKIVRAVQSSQVSPSASPSYTNANSSKNKSSSSKTNKIPPQSVFKASNETGNNVTGATNHHQRADGNPSNLSSMPAPSPSYLSPNDSRRGSAKNHRHDNVQDDDECDARSDHAFPDGGKLVPGLTPCGTQSGLLTFL